MDQLQTNYIEKYVETVNTLRVTAVVGNPKPLSRTQRVAEAVTSRVIANLEDHGFATSRTTIELADVMQELFDWSSDTVQRLVDEVSASHVVVIASPTYKASYTGLLKAFLDRLDRGGLSDVAVVPVMLGATPRHALGMEVHLRPLLVELGAVIPTQGLFVLEKQVEHLEPVVDTWAEIALPQLRRLLS